MRCLAHIALVTVIQFIACYLADWGNAETVFMLFFIVLWQGLFIWLFSQIRKKRDVSDEFKFSKGVWYITMPVSSFSVIKPDGFYHWYTIRIKAS